MYYEITFHHNELMPCLFILWSSIIYHYGTFTSLREKKGAKIGNCGYNVRFCFSLDPRAETDTGK